MEQENNNKQLTLTTALKTFEVFAVSNASKSIEVIAKQDREPLKMFLVAMFTDLGNFFKVQQKMEPSQIGELVLMVMKHDTYKTYTIEQYTDFCSRVKMGTLKGSDGKPMKVFNRFDVPMVFELLASFNGEVEEKKELKSKDEKHGAIDNTKKMVGSLFEIFDDLAKKGYDTKVSDLSGKKKIIDKEKSREAMNHYNNFLTLLELEEEKDGKILYDGKRITSAEYLTLKTKT